MTPPPMVMVMMVMVVVVMVVVVMMVVVMMVIVLGEHDRIFRSPLVRRLFGLGLQDIGGIRNRIQQFRE